MTRDSTELQAVIDRLVSTSPQRWVLIAVAVSCAVTASAATAAAGGSGGVVLALVGAVAAVAVLRPDGHAAAIAVAIVLVQWSFSVEDATTPWALAAALALLVFHATVSLMAVTPITATIDLGVLSRWGRRVAVVAAGTGVVWSAVVVMEDRQPSAGTLLTAAALLLLTVLVTVARVRSHPVEG